MSRRIRRIGTLLFLTGGAGIFGLVLYRASDWLLNLAVEQAARKSFGVIGRTDGAVSVFIAAGGGNGWLEVVCWCLSVILVAVGFYLRHKKRS